MQVHNVNLPITVTGRHVDITDALRQYAIKKVEGLHLDYPRIIEARVILDVQKHHNQQKAEIILFCANHIVIEVDSTTHDLYSAIDESISKIARRMRKFKTAMLKSHHRPRKVIKDFDQQIFQEEHVAESEAEHVEPAYVHHEKYAVRPLYPDEAVVDAALSDRNFVIFHNQRTHKLAILYRRKDGEYGMIEPEMSRSPGAASNPS
jgi:putative sigma-54 modulation protein